MSIRSDVMVLTVFELIKVSIEIAIKKKRLSIDVLREKKSAGVAQLFLPCRCGADVRGGAHE